MTALTNRSTVGRLRSLIAIITLVFDAVWLVFIGVVVVGMDGNLLIGTVLVLVVISKPLILVH